MLNRMKYPAPTGRYADFARRLIRGMEQEDVSPKDLAEATKGDKDMKSALEKVRLWMRGERMPRDKDNLRKVATLIGMDVAELRYGAKGEPIKPPLMRGEHITDEDELALVRAYRGMQVFAKRRLKKRAVELLEEFGEPGVENPFGKHKPS